jgi:hypothetical protein
MNKQDMHGRYDNTDDQIRKQLLFGIRPAQSAINGPITCIREFHLSPHFFSLDAPGGKGGFLRMYSQWTISLIPELESRARKSAACDQRNDGQYQEHDQQYLSNPSSIASYTTEAEHPSDYGDDEKYYCPADHGKPQVKGIGRNRGDNCTSCTKFLVSLGFNRVEEYFCDRRLIAQACGDESKRVPGNAGALTALVLFYAAQLNQSLQGALDVEKKRYSDACTLTISLFTEW